MGRWLVWTRLTWMGLAWGLPAWAGNLADVQIVDSHSGRLLQQYQYDGHRYVAGQVGEEFMISIGNRSDEDVLAVISVDGVNVVSGETASTGQSGYVIAAGQSLDVKGWRKALDRIAAFYFTAHRDAYATRTGRPENTGVIGVALFKRRAVSVEGQLLGRAEQKRSARAAAGSAQDAAPAPDKTEQPSLGTGHGRQQISYARYVVFERRSETPDELIAIEYDSRTNLVARGILPTTPHQPRPFPVEFVPDPPC